MSISTLQQSVIKEKRQARLPWPIPERPRLVPICRSPLAVYGIVVALEAWATNDPRAVASFRAQRHERGRALADTLLLHRVPLAGLTREAAQKIFGTLAARLRERAALEALP